MNIFVLSADPVEAARMLCDKHIVKLILEAGMLLCAAHPVGVPPWRRSHYNHPCAVWARASTENYRWLAVHGLSMCEEYTRRYGRRHRSEDVLLWCAENVPEDVPVGPLTPFVVAIKNPAYHIGDPVDPVLSYREYYLRDKVRFARWRYCDPPDWWHKVDEGNI